MATGIAPGTFEETEARVLDVVKTLARELGGERFRRGFDALRSKHVR